MKLGASIQKPFNGLNNRTAAVTEAEFFWGTSDPGEGSGTPLLSFDNNFNEVIEEVVYNSLTSPSSGNLNLFNIRLKDENNVWGPVYKKVIASSNIVRDIKIQQAEYFWGTSDPGEGSGTSVSAIDGNFNEAIEEIITNGLTSATNDGLNVFNIRLKDENDQWGPLYKHAIVNHNASTTPEITTTGTLNQFTACSGSVSSEQNFIVQGENLLSGISISAPTGYEISLTPGNNYGTNININNSGGTVSQTTVYVRLKSNANNGSSGTVSLILQVLKLKTFLPERQ